VYDTTSDFASVDGFHSQLNDLEHFMRESDSQDVLFSLVSYHHFHSWLVSVGKYIAVTKACTHRQNQISSHLGLIQSDAITQSIFKDEKEVVQGMLGAVTVGHAGVYDLRDDDANNFLNLLQEVRRLMFAQATCLSVQFLDRSGPFRYWEETEASPHSLNHDNAIVIRSA
jgi:hypothetical protein